MAHLGIQDLDRFLCGTWRIRREILTGGEPPGAFDGWGCFERDPESPGLLRYLERGELRLADHRGRASRRLRYHIAGPRASVTFDDGRFFHDLDLRHGVWEVEHPCRADHYSGRFEVTSEREWQHRWDVIGPWKSYVVRTALVYDDGPRPQNEAARVAR